jgi:hypothetical protein
MSQKRNSIEKITKYQEDYEDDDDEQPIYRAYVQVAKINKTKMITHLELKKTSIF